MKGALPASVVAIAIAILAMARSIATERLVRVPSGECPSFTGAADDPVAVRVPHEEDRARFYECTGAARRAMLCPLYAAERRLHYDPELQRCTCPLTWDQSCRLERDRCGTGARVNPYDCRTYYACEDGVETLRTCASGEKFDARRLTCVPETEAECTVYLDRCPPDKYDFAVLLPHECRCAQHYECTDDRRLVERYCPSGQEFDVNRRECVPAREAVCYASELMPSPIKCPASGIKYIPHPTDCALYYECVNGVVSLKRCDDGLSFNAELGMCSWPPSIDCSSRSISRRSIETGIESRAASRVVAAEARQTWSTWSFECAANGSTSAATFPHHCSCSKYYVCTGGQTILGRCPNDMEYDHRKGSCVAAGTAACKNREHESILVGGGAARGRRCSANGNERLPHENDCSLYYQCQRGVKNVRSCLQGHYFNAVIEACDLVDESSCIYDTSTTVDPIDGECPTNVPGCEPAILRLPNPRDCSSYYKCEAGKMVAKSCPRELHFDPVEQICDWPENVGCTPQPGCAAGEKLQHECQCELYYECGNDGELILRQCPAGKRFDYQRKICLDADAAVCYPGQENANGCIGRCAGPDSTENLPHEDCRKYCACDAGVGRVDECPANKYYDPVKRRCDWPENVADLKCDPFPCTSEAAVATLPHECYCDRYYRCERGTKWLEMCEDGLRFDYEKGGCVASTDAHCFWNDPVPETEEEKGCSDAMRCTADVSSTRRFGHKDCRKFCACVNRRRRVHECPAGLYYDASRGMCNWPENIKGLPCNPFVCPRHTDPAALYLPHECDCRIYYVCNDGTISRSVCDQGYEFDYVKQLCVKAGQAHCYRKPSANEIVEAENCIGTCPTPDIDGTARLPHKDCTKYCVCQAGAPYTLTCPKGTRYDTALGICARTDSALPCER